MRYKNILLLAGILTFVLSATVQAAPSGFKEYKLDGLTIDLPADWELPPDEVLAQVRKQTGTAQLLMLAAAPNGVPQLTIMEQPMDTMDQKAFGDLTDAEVQALCDTAKSRLGSDVEFLCGREKTSGGIGLSTNFLISDGSDNPGVRTVSMTFHRGSKVSSITTLFQDNGDEKLMPQIKAIMQSIRLSD